MADIRSALKYCMHRGYTIVSVREDKGTYDVGDVEGEWETKLWYRRRGDSWCVDRRVIGRTSR